MKPVPNNSVTAEKSASLVRASMKTVFSRTSEVVNSVTVNISSGKKHANKIANWD
jgi:hypothetical protein